MHKNIDILYMDIEENKMYNDQVEKVLKECLAREKLKKIPLFITIILTTDEEIKKINKEQRNIDKSTDVLSFPIYEKEEIEEIKRNRKTNVPIILGDVIISIPTVIKQAEEYGHSLKRELSYMVVHAFCHLIGHDHIEEKDKIEMRKKEEEILEKLKITRM